MKSINYTESTFTVIDIETTGCDRNSEIIELAGVKIVPSLSIDYDNIFSTLIKPRNPIDESNIAFAINKISNNMVADAPSITDVLPKFLEFSEGTIIVGHNVGFDIGYIKRELEKHNLTPSYDKVIDNLKYARTAFKGLINHKLDTLIDYCNVSCPIDSNNRHRALYDTLCTAEVFISAIRRLKLAE